jgi:hypothetical protein
MKVVKALSFLVLLLAFFLTASSAQASLVTIGSEGKVILNVLSVEDSIELEIPRRDYLQVKNIVAGTPDPDAIISLARVDGKVKLNVLTKSGEKSLDVTNYKEEIVEIEERPELERLTIAIQNDKFTIEQKGITAVTDFAINIDPQTAGLTLETPSGFRYLSILPRQAVETLLRSKVINRIASGSRISLAEYSGELFYEVTGERVINLFNIFDYRVPVSARVSASTGEILTVEQPTWLRIFGFLFV